MNYRIGIDIGGTKLHGVLIGPGVSRRIVRRVHASWAPTTRGDALAELVSFIATILPLKARERVMGMGLGVPGTLDRTARLVRTSPNVPSLTGLALAGTLERLIGLPVRLENDARCFTLGAELPMATRMRRPRVVVGLTLGTGLGGGVRVGSHLFVGAGAAGEFGHLLHDPNGPRCSCGAKGCLELYASAKFFARGKSGDPMALAKSARAGNRAAKYAYAAFGEALGHGIGGVVNAFNPDVVVLGGGLAHASALFLPAAKSAAKIRILSPDAKQTPIVVAANLDDAGALGAALLFQ